MHIPDGYLGPITSGSCWVILIPILGYASKKVKKSVQTTEIPYLAMASVFSLLAMMFVMPIPGGTTGHISGTALLAILLGPWSAIIAVSISLIIQAVVLGEGGITAIGANCLNVAVLGSCSGSVIFVLFVKMFRFLKIKESVRVPLAGGIAAYSAINLGALSTAVMLGLQPIFYGEASGGGYFPFSMSVVIPAAMIPHLTLVGALEAIVTFTVLSFLIQRGVGLRALQWLFVLFVFGVFEATVFAHDYWIEPKDDGVYHGITSGVATGFALVYGHRDERLPYDLNQLKKVRVFDANEKELNFRKEVQSNAMLIFPQGNACVILAELESGYWSKTIYGLKNIPKRKATRPIESYQAFHYSKSIVSSCELGSKGVGQVEGQLKSQAVTQPIKGLRLDIVPAQNPFKMKAGERLALRVVFEGKPVIRATIERDHEKVGETDSDGWVRVLLKKGRQLYTVEKRDPIQTDPDADFVSTTTTLTFEVNS